MDSKLTPIQQGSFKHFWGYVVQQGIIVMHHNNTFSKIQELEVQELGMKALSVFDSQSLHVLNADDLDFVWCMKYFMKKFNEMFYKELVLRLRDSMFVPFGTVVSFSVLETQMKESLLSSKEFSVRQDLLDKKSFDYLSVFIQQSLMVMKFAYADHVLVSNKYIDETQSYCVDYKYCMNWKFYGYTKYLNNKYWKEIYDKVNDVYLYNAQRLSCKLVKNIPNICFQVNMKSNYTVLPSTLVIVTDDVVKIYNDNCKESVTKEDLKKRVNSGVYNMISYKQKSNTRTRLVDSDTAIVVSLKQHIHKSLDDKISSCLEERDNNQKKYFSNDSSSDELSSSITNVAGISNMLNEVSVKKYTRYRLTVSTDKTYKICRKFEFNVKIHLSYELNNAILSSDVLCSNMQFGIDTIIDSFPHLFYNLQHILETSVSMDHSSIITTDLNISATLSSSGIKIIEDNALSSPI